MGAVRDSDISSCSELLVPLSSGERALLGPWGNSSHSLNLGLRFSICNTKDLDKSSFQCSYSLRRKPVSDGPEMDAMTT